jgi:predicted phosphodiesterase
MAMNGCDLGQMDGPVLIFGGPYSNLQASRALLERAAAEQIAGARMICTGDVVAYCADPAGTVAAIRDAGCTVVAGNCELQLAAGEADCGCGFAPGSTCDRLSAGWFAHADARLDQEARDWMAGLPDSVIFTHHGRRCAVIHGGVSDVARFLWPTSPEAEFAQEIALIEAAHGPVDMVLAGHCGLPFMRRIGRVDWVNAGVIGMPPNDGCPETRFAVLDHGVPRIERLSYDHPAARDAMLQAGLTQGYHLALGTGYWPSEDVLPPDLRRAATASG